MTHPNQEAQRLLLMLQYGLQTPEQIISWADEQIVALPSPSEPLINLSTTKPSNIADIESLLRQLAAGADFWMAFRCLLGSLHDYLRDHPKEAPAVANKFWKLAITSPKEVPEDLKFLFHFDDAFDMASDGTY